MKWIKTAIGAVIAVFTIGIIATTVFKMTQPREVTREVSFEIDYDEGKYYPISAYNEIVDYGVFDENKYVINLVSSFVNEIEVELQRIKFDDFDDRDWIVFVGGGIDSYIDADGNWFDDGSDINDNVNIKLVFEVSQPPQLSGINATLILLIPTVFAGGLLLYFYKPLKEKD